jgi:hypothetical protein
MQTFHRGFKQPKKNDSSILDDLVKSRKSLMIVIPAKAGIQ